MTDMGAVPAGGEEERDALTAGVKGRKRRFR